MAHLMRVHFIMLRLGGDNGGVVTDYDNVEGWERYLNLPIGSLRNIPIYARKPAIDAIKKVKDMEGSSLFRPGLYYIVLVDLCANTIFNEKYGDKEGDLRTQWFHTSVIKSIGEISPNNYIAFSKTIGDASLLIFSSILDVLDWSNRLDHNLTAMSQEYEEYAHDNHDHLEEEVINKMIDDFRLRARRLVHLGEVSFKEDIDPMCLSVSQTFKIEKYFSEEALGCTQAVADVAGPKLLERKLVLAENVTVSVPGAGSFMTYYFKANTKKSK